MAANRTIRFFLLAVAGPLAVYLVYLGARTVVANLFGWVPLAIGVSYCLSLPVLLRRESKPAAVSREEGGDRSFWLLLPGFVTVIYASPLEWVYLPAWLPRSPPAQAAGLALLAAGVLLHVWARSSMGRLFSGHVQVQADHHLVCCGPYRLVRHPVYASYVLINLGFAVGYSSLIGLLAIPVLLLPGLAYRIGVEERLLAAHFAAEYQAYAARTWRLIPGVW